MKPVSVVPHPGSFSSSAVGHALRSILSLGLATVLSAALAFFTQVLLARRLPVAEYGALASALATVTLVAPLAGLGLGPFWLHVFGVEGWRGHRWLLPSLWAFAASTLLVWILVALFAAAAGLDPMTRITLVILLPVVLAQAAIQLVHARCQLEQRYRALAVWHLVSPAGRFLVAVLASGVYVAAAGFSVSALFISAAAGVIVHRALKSGFSLAGHGRGHAGREGAPAVRTVIAAAFPFCLSGLLHFIYLQSDIVLVGWLVDSTAAGHYNVAFTGLSALYLLPSVTNQKYLLPKLHRWASQDPHRLLEIHNVAIGAMLGSGVLAMAGVLLFADGAVAALFGPQYAEGVLLLKVLAFAVPARYVSTFLGSLLTTRSHLARKVRLQVVTAVFNVVLNLLLIPKYGAVGAAVATVATEITLLGTYFFCTRRHVLVPILRTVEGTSAPRE
jgi:O-antigen/teichoic acid export membrane protein